ncbi:MAG: hypothetical protein ACLT8E_06400 [Akkermansia sp.]
MLVPYYLIRSKRLTGNRRGKWHAPAHGAWPPRQACSYAIGMLLLNSIPGGGEFVRLLLFKPLIFS